MDGSVVKAAALALQGQAGNTAQQQRQIVEGLLAEVYTLGSEVSILGVMAEGTAKFSKAEREANASAYQYASRLKSIVGACLFAATDAVIEDKAVPAYTLKGDVNTMYSEAVKALRVRDLDWKGEQVSAAKSEKAALKRAAAEGIEKYKLEQVRPGASLADLEADIKANVSAAEAASMLETIGKRAEKFAERMIKDQGFEYAFEFARTLLAAVQAQQQ